MERSPQRLYDRRLAGFEISEATKVEVKTATGTAKRLAHTQKDKNGETLWTDDEDNAQPKPTYDSWMDKISKVRLASYASDAEEAQLATVKPFLVISLEKAGKVEDEIAFKKLPGDKPNYFVTSKFLKTHGKLFAPRIEPIEKDLGQIVGVPK